MAENKMLIKIKKAATYPKGTEAMKMLDDVTSGEYLNIPVFITFNQGKSKYEFYLEQVDKEGKNAIGFLEKGQTEAENLIKDILDGKVTYKCFLDGYEGSTISGYINYTKAEKKEIVVDSSVFDDLKKKIIENNICSAENLERNIKIMKQHRCPDELIRQVLATYRKYDKPACTPKTIYVDPEPKGSGASILARCLLNSLIGAATIYEGDKSVGKNVCAETVAMLLNQPYYVITFNRGMTGDDIYGTKSTDNSAANFLTKDLADAYNEYQKMSPAFSRDEDYAKYLVEQTELVVKSNGKEGVSSNYLEDYKKVMKKRMLEHVNKYNNLREKAAEYEQYKAKAASIAIIQEESVLVEWLRNGGVMCFNEMNMAEANFFASFANPITDGSLFIDIPGYGRIPINKDCHLIGTQNAEYTGVCEQNDATMSRFGCIQFDYPGSIKPQLKAVCGSKLHDMYYKQTDDFYQALLSAVRNGQVENSCLNIRGFIRALNAVAQVPGLTTLVEQIQIHVINTCPVDDRNTLTAQLIEKVTL